MIPTFDGNMEIIRRLADEPNDVGGLTAEQLKYEFDRAGELIKTYLNTLLVPSLTADNFPVGELPGISVNTLQAVLLALVGQIQSLAADQSAAADDITELQTLHTQDVAALHEELDEIWTAVNELQAAAVAIDPITGLSGVYNVQAALEALQAAIEGGTPPATVPSAPQAFAATAGNAQLALAWTAPASNGGSQITGYQVSTGGTTWTDVGLVTVYALTGLTNGTSYTVYVRAVNGVGVGLAASTTGIPVAPVTVPTAPRNFVTMAGNTQIILTWAAPASDGGSPITGYQVTTGASWVSVGNVLTKTMTGLVNGTTYTCQVRAVNAVGTGPAVAASATPAAPATVPGAPIVGKYYSPTPTTVMATWSPGSTGGSPITGYEIRGTYVYGSSTYTTNWVSFDASIRSSTMSTTYTSGVTYYLVQCQLRAKNAIGTGDYTSISINGGAYIETIITSNSQLYINRDGSAHNIGESLTLSPINTNKIQRFKEDWMLQYDPEYIEIYEENGYIWIRCIDWGARGMNVEVTPAIINRLPGQIVPIQTQRITVTITM
jgi:hypothetical protein